MNKILFFGSLIFLGACGGTDDFGPPSTEYVPVMMLRSDMEAAVLQQPPREISDPAKIYAYGDFLLISEKFQGIHVINNQDPARPSNIGFVRIPGCVDMAVRGTTLFADNATDLISLDVSDPTDVKLISRVKDAFPVLLPPDLGLIPETYQNRPEDMIIIEWRK